MSLARRLISAGGGGGIIVPGLPADDGWTRQGVVMSGDVAWEQSLANEPTVIWEDGWKMWYRGGWANEALAYATSTDGLTWTKYGSNPILGQSGGGVTGNAAQPEVRRYGSTYWCWYTEFLESGDMVTATSTDGLAWTKVADPAITQPAGIGQWGNRAVWKESSTWYMLLEGSNASDGIWQIYLATSSDGETWTLGNSGNPLTDLEVASGGSYGGPNVILHGGRYHCWYHATPGAGATPTNIYHSYSTDRVTWSTPVLVLEYLGSASEIDQIADPALVLHEGTWYMFYSAVDNPNETGVIKLATALAT